MMDFAKMLTETNASNEVIDSFTNAARTQYGSDAYAAGYLGSMLVRAMNEMPKARRAEFRKQILEQAHQLGKDILVK